MPKPKKFGREERTKKKSKDKNPVSFYEESSRQRVTDVKRGPYYGRRIPRG
jgi:hypothetical protein